jgi:hypothetical protein
MKEVPMAYYKLLIHAWLDWDPSESDLEEIGRRTVLRDGVLCTARESSPSLTDHRKLRTRKP